ncbi:MAG: gliding motility protein GldN [Edaphocola sp.]
MSSISKKYSVLFAGCVALGSNVAMAQKPGTADPSAQAVGYEAVNKTWQPSLTKDGVIDVVPHVNKALDLHRIREADAGFKRRIWRQIDVRQKQNQAFIYKGDEYSGGGAFIEILIDAIKKGKVAAYSNIDDRFTSPLNLESFEKSLGGGRDTTWVENPETGEQTMRILNREFNVNTVTKYRIKEDWVFDRNAGRMVVRIVGIAPLRDEYNESTGDFMFSTPMFWLNYEELRKVLVNYEVYNPQNDLNRLTWTDYLDGRYFSSYVIKSSASNPTGEDFVKGLRGLEEGERALEAIRAKEDDMWAH